MKTSFTSVYDFLDKTKDMNPREVWTTLYGLSEGEITKIFTQKNEEQREAIHPKEQKNTSKEKLSSVLPNAVQKQEKEAMDYFAANNETNHMDVITQVQKRRKQWMISYKNMWGDNYEVNFRFPWSPMTRYLPPDLGLTDSEYEYTLWDDTEIKNKETTKGKLQSTEGKKYLKEKESKEKKVLPSKENFLKLGKLLCPNGSEEEQILAFMMATWFYGYMRLSDIWSNYQLAVACCRSSGDRGFDELNSDDSECSCIYTAAL